MKYNITLSSGIGAISISYEVKMMFLLKYGNTLRTAMKNVKMLTSDPMPVLKAIKNAFTVLSKEKPGKNPIVLDVELAAKPDLARFIVSAMEMEEAKQIDALTYAINDAAIKFHLEMDASEALDILQSIVFVVEKVITESDNSMKDLINDVFTLTGVEDEE